MTEIQSALVEKAERALESAAANLERGDAEVVVNRAYYACFNVARAALLGVGDEPKTHSGVHNRFALRFVATGQVPTAIGRTLPYTAQVRERADYDAIPLTDLGAAADLLADAGRFVEAVRKLVDNEPS